MVKWFGLLEPAASYCSFFEYLVSYFSRLATHNFLCLDT
jgi:hypothetical protein